MLNVTIISRQDAIDYLDNSIEILYHSYLKEKDSYVEELEKKQKEYGKMLLAIDNISTAYIKPLFHQLYQILEELGSPSKKPSFVTLLTDHKRKEDKKEVEIKRTYHLAKKRLSKVQPEAKDMVTKLIYELTYHKKKIETGNQDLKVLRDKIRERKQEYQDEIRKISEMIPKLKAYFESLVRMKECMEMIILPELEGVRAFLVARTMVTQITVRQIQESLILDSVLKLANTPYEKHYYLIKQIYLFYSNSLQFLESPISVDFTTKLSITPKDFSWLLEQKQQLERSIMEIKKNLFYVQPGEM